jgi:DNA-binding XRE family transcriptional regulator
MLPFCDRRVCVPRKDVAPVWTRSFPISKEPITLGEHLKKKRFGAGIRQSEAARILGVSDRSLSLWECDRLFPATPYHARIIAYLGYDPFKNLVKPAPK